MRSDCGISPWGDEREERHGDDDRLAGAEDEIRHEVEHAREGDGDRRGSRDRLAVPLPHHTSPQSTITSRPRYAATGELCLVMPSGARLDLSTRAEKAQLHELGRACACPKQSAFAGAQPP